MTHDELNQYIFQYLTENKTRSAIMLTAPWGSGKSYYIEEILKPFIQSDENGIKKTDKDGEKEKTKRRKCIVVSLYDISSTKELSKALYFEKKLPAFMKTKKASKFAAVSKAVATGLIGVGKTVLKALTKIDIDLNFEKLNLEKLQKHVDFMGDLIVLEDLERSKIAVTEVLGYVNNLVEHDGVKVLLVANEDEIIKGTIIKEKDSQGKDKTRIEYNQEEKKYIREKEKTISDTVQYTGNAVGAIENILFSFEDSNINEFLKEKDERCKSRIASDILKIMKGKGDCTNLRSVIFGCQKTVEIYKYADDSFDKEFLRYLLCSNIAFALRFKENTNILWGKEVGSSPQLGTYEYPLLRVCYDYIKMQRIDKSLLKLANDIYVEQRRKESIKKDVNEQLGIIYSFHLQPESVVRNGIIKIMNKLEKTNDIPPKEYIQLANYLVVLRRIIGCDSEIDRCRDAMINNLKNTSFEKTNKPVYFGGVQLNSQEEREEFSKWREQMEEIIKRKEMKNEIPSYNKDGMDLFFEQISSNVNSYYDKKQFAAFFDVEKLIGYLQESTPEEIVNVRKAFQKVYEPSNVGEFLTEDKDALCKIKDELGKLINDPNKPIDKISRFHLANFIKYDLEEFINKLQ